MHGLVEKASRLREGFFETKRNKDRLTAENIVVLDLKTEILGFKTRSGSPVGSFQKVNAPAIETKRDLIKTQKAAAGLESINKTLKD